MATAYARPHWIDVLTLAVAGWQYHTIVGNAASLMWDIMSKFTLGFFFKVQSWKASTHDGLSGLDIVVLVA